MSTVPAASSPSVDPPRDTLLASFLATRDVPCPNPRCGFNLHGLNQSACPECGEVLRLAVVRPEALWFLRKWVVVAAIVFTIFINYRLAAIIPDISAYRSIRLNVIYPWSWLVLHAGVGLGLLGALIRYAITRRNPRALPRLLVSFMLTTIIFCVGSGVLFAIVSLR